MNKKALICCILVLVMCLAAFAACSTAIDNETLGEIIADVERTERSNTETPASYQLNAQVPTFDEKGNPATVYIRWTIEDTTLITVSQRDASGKVTVNIPEQRDAAIEYKLRATLVNEKDQPLTDADKQYSVVFSRVAPQSVEGQLTVTYNFNDGATENQTVFAQAGGSVTLPTPTRANYTFDGWFDSLTGGTLVGAGGASYVVNASITLYAHWTANQGGGGQGDDPAPNNVTVTFAINYNGGTNPAPQTVAKGASITLPGVARTGYTLDGWYTESSGGTLAGKAGENYVANANITLYAHWTAEQQQGGGGSQGGTTPGGGGSQGGGSTGGDVGGTTVTIDLATYASQNDWTVSENNNVVPYTSLDCLCATVTVDATQNSQSTSGVLSGAWYTNWRLYSSESATLTFSAKSGYTLVSVRITATDKDKGSVASFIVGSQTYSSDDAIPVNGSSVTIAVGGKQARISKIEITYSQGGSQGGGGGTTPGGGGTTPGGGGSQGGGSGTQTAIPSGNGSQSSPYNAADAISAATALAQGQYSATAVYVKGYVLAGSTSQGSTPYKGGSGDWKMHLGNSPDSSENFYVTFATPASGITDVKVGDLVVVYGYLENYYGATMYGGGSSDKPMPQLLSCESGSSSGGSTGGGSTGGEVSGTSVTIDMATYATQNNWTVSVQDNVVPYTSVDCLCATITVNATQNPQSTSGVLSGAWYTNWRLYSSESATLNFNAKSGYKITSVQITYTNGVLSNNGTDVTSGEVVTVNGSSLTLSVSSGQARITKIVIGYTQA